MAFRVIRAHRGPGCSVVVHARDEEGCCKEEFYFNRFRPYFYAPEDENRSDDAITGSKLGFVGLHGEKLKRIYLKNPSDTPRVRDLFTRHWEADIPYARRFLIDKQITSGFDFVDRKSENIVPAELPPMPLVIHYLDIECLPPKSGGMPNADEDPITCLCFGSGGEYASGIFDPGIEFMSDKDGWFLGRFPNERDLLVWATGILLEQDPDVITGWNVAFDLEYFKRRCEVHEVPFSIDSSCQFDLLGGYRGVYRKKSYRLKDVALEEGLITEPEPTWDYRKVWEEDKMGLLALNRNHTKWCYEIDQKHNVVDYYWAQRELAGLEDMKDIFYVSVIHDTSLLRRTEWALPSKENRPRERYEGAYVMDPPRGILEGIAVFDVSSFYPNIIISERLDPKIIKEFLEQNGGVLDWVKYKEFAQGRPTLILSYTEELLREKDALKVSPEHKEKYMAMKALVNSLYGAFALPSFRLYTQEIPERITEVARTVLQDLIKELGEWGYRVVAADTDSCFVQVEKSKVGGVELQINSWLGGEYSVKLEHYFEALLLTGKKKRYAGIEGGSLYFAGFEFKRSDSSNLTRDLQEELFRMMLNGEREGIIEFLRAKVEQVKTAPLTDLAITRTLSRDPGSYIKGKQDWIKSIQESAWLDWVGAGDAINTVPAKNYPYNVCAYQDVSSLPHPPQIDYNTIVKKQIQAKVTDILPLVDLYWDEVMGRRRLL